MIHSDFIKQNGLHPGDSVLLNTPFNFSNGYAIYLEGETFMVNIHGTVRLISVGDLGNFLKKDVPVLIRRFKGNDLQRKTAVQMALTRCDVATYNIITNNCQSGIGYVKQINNYNHEATTVGTGMTLGGIALAAGSRNAGLKGVGLLIAIFGLIALASDND